MSTLTRTLAVGATLAAISLAGMTTVAHAQPADEPTRHDASRPPTQGQVGEAWRHRQAVTPEQAAADTAHRRRTTQEQSYDPPTRPAQAPAPTQADEPNRQPGWIMASLGVLVVLLLVAGLAMLVVRRARRRAPPPAPSPTR